MTRITTYRALRHFTLLLGLLLAACQPGGDTATAQLPTAAIVLHGTTQPSITQPSEPPAIPAERPTAPPTPTATLAPTATPIPQPWRFVVLGDTRTEGLQPPEVTGAIVARAAEAHPELTLAVGDLINALDTQPEVREQWRNWRAAVAPLAPSQERAEPWLLITPGNHDVQNHGWATQLLTEAFPELPTNGPDGFERRTYAVDYRGVRFISIDSERLDAMHQLGDAQLDWLEAQLRDNPNRHTIVFSHDPAYPVGPHIGSSLDAYPKGRDRLWQLLRDNHVTAYIAGHEHLYNHQQIDGVHQIIAGTSGSFVYAGYGGEFYHYVVGEVGDSGITFTVYDRKGAERDRFTVP